MAKEVSEVVMDQTCCIFDGPEKFKESCVHYIRFRSFELRQMFAYLREREMILQKDVMRMEGTSEEWGLRIVLQTVESMLIWMVANVPGLEVDGKVARQKKRA